MLSIPSECQGKPVLWGLVDCNTFYCSCERLFRPDLRDKPVVVLSNNDGCLIALTPEAKALGYKMGDVYHLLARQLDRDKVEVFSSNYTLYGDISSRVMRTIAGIAPVEQYSIDETFIPLHRPLAVQAEAVGWQIHERVRKWVGVPVRVGIGSTRTLAKLANHWAKKRTRVFTLKAGEPLTEECLEATAVRDVWGIGRRQAAKLEGRGVRTARQLRDMDLDLALKLLTIVGQRTVLELRGYQCIMEDELPLPRKTLVSSRSFGRRVTRREDIAEALAMHAAIAGERLRSENMVASAISVWAQTSKHTEKPYHSIRADLTFPRPCNCTTDLIRYAHAALDRCYEPGHDFMKGGLMLYDLDEEHFRQLRLLETSAPVPDRGGLMKVLDEINGKMGPGTLRLAAQGAPDAFWRMQRNKLSDHTTTQWGDLWEVKCK